MSKKTVEGLIEERGGGAGYFDIMKTTGELQDVFKNQQITSERRAYLNILCHKMARLIHGYGDDDDNLLDIAGYSELERRGAADIRAEGVLTSDAKNLLNKVLDKAKNGGWMTPLITSGSVEFEVKGLSLEDVNKVIKLLDQKYKIRSCVKKNSCANPYSEGIRDGVRMAVEEFERAIYE